MKEELERILRATPLARFGRGAGGEGTHPSSFELTSMRRSFLLLALAILVLTSVALAIRLPRLGQRPMHGDEANQAVKAGILLETGVYRYDPHEHPGPVLYWLTLPSLRLSGAGDF